MHDEATLLPPGTLLTGVGTFFKKFTPFKDKFLETFRLPLVRGAPEGFSPKKLPATLDYTVVTTQSPSRAVALELLRNVATPDPEELLTSKTSGISPYLKLGVVSVREVYKAFKKHHSLIEGLIWRDFYYNVAVGYPGVLEKSLPFRKEAKWWYTKPTDKPFVLWTQGKTGFPVVDACMRELKETGELCGRGRMIVGSFLTKILFVDWRLGEWWFAKNLVDYDPILNNGNWQWVAGCGVDVQQYIRIFNPTLQGLKHDPEGTYVKRWVFELKDLTLKEIYSDERKTIVDYKKRRAIAMKLFM